MSEQNTPAHWFHPSIPYTSGNEVNAFVCGQEYMADLYQTINSTSDGDFIYATGWLFSIDQCLLGQDNPESNFISLLLDKAVQKNVKVKILPWFPVNQQKIPAKENSNEHTALLIKAWEINNPNFQVSLAASNIWNASH